MLKDIENKILSRLSIEVKIAGDSNGVAGEIEIRSRDEEFKPPFGWSIKSEVITQSAFFTFSFDAQARSLQELYLERFIDLRKFWISSETKLIKEGFVFNYTLDGRDYDLDTFPLTEASHQLRITARVDVIDNELRVLPEENLEDFIVQFVSMVLIPLIPDESHELEADFSEIGMPEGAITKVLVNKYERSPKNRAACLSYFGTECQGCGFSFGEKYGKFAEGYIHVHHIIPISQIGVDYVVNPATDLVPLCPNCHAAIHLKNPPYKVEELRHFTGFVISNEH